MSVSRYLLLAILLLVAACLIFRVFVRRDYLRHGRLTLFSASLEYLIFASWCWFTWADWPRGGLPSGAGAALEAVAWVLIILGLGTMLAVMAWFGIRRAHGLQVDELKQTGPYRWSRNPQIVTSFPAAIGYALLWPSWHTLGWVLLLAVILQLMVLTEEEHLQERFGLEYERYRKRVPRYLRFGRRRAVPPDG